MAKMEFLLKRGTKAQIERFNERVLDDAELLYVYPEPPETRGGIMRGDGITQIKDLPWVMPPGTGPRSASLVDMLVEMYINIKGEVKQ